MLGGIFNIGVVTATIASSLVDRVREISDTEQAATRADFEAPNFELLDRGPLDLAAGLREVAGLHQSGALTEYEVAKAKSKLSD